MTPSRLDERPPACTVAEWLHADQARSDRSGSEKQGGRAVQALPGQVEDATGPGCRRAVGRVHRDAGASSRLVVQRRRGLIEEGARRVRIAAGASEHVGRDREPSSDRGQRPGRVIEAIPDLTLHTRERRLIGGAEARALEGQPDQRDADSGQNAGAHNAQDGSHRMTQML